MTTGIDLDRKMQSKEKGKRKTTTTHRLYFEWNKLSQCRRKELFINGRGKEKGPVREVHDNLRLGSNKTAETHNPLVIFLVFGDVDFRIHVDFVEGTGRCRRGLLTDPTHQLREHCAYWPAKAASLRHHTPASLHSPRLDTLSLPVVSRLLPLHTLCVCLALCASSTRHSLCVICLREAVCLGLPRLFFLLPNRPQFSPLQKYE